MSPECKDLVDRLLQLDPCDRFGHRGAGEIKLHPWFRGLDWTSLARTKAAFIPAVDSETDTSYFFDKPVWEAVYSVLLTTFFALALFLRRLSSQRAQLVLSLLLTTSALHAIHSSPSLCHEACIALECMHRIACLPLKVA